MEPRLQPVGLLVLRSLDSAVKTGKHNARFAARRGGRCAVAAQGDPITRSFCSHGGNGGGGALLGPSAFSLGPYAMS